MGWIGELSRWLNVGATYQSRTYASRFSRYSGLFAEGDKFDIPANFAGGVAVKIHPKATVQFDAERILYGQVKSVANSDANQAPLGTTSGPGFGWHDITVIKTGLDYEVDSLLTIRGGYNHAGLPFGSTQTFFNLLAPAVTQDHLHRRRRGRHHPADGRILLRPADRSNTESVGTENRSGEYLGGTPGSVRTELFQTPCSRSRQSCGNCADHGASCQAVGYRDENHVAPGRKGDRAGHPGCGHRPVGNPGGFLIVGKSDRGSKQDQGWEENSAGTQERKPSLNAFNAVARWCRMKPDRCRQ